MKRGLDDISDGSSGAGASKMGSGLAAKQRIEAEYKNWMVAAPQIYDVCMAKNLKWPSLTVEWLPGIMASSREGWNRHSLLVGTHTDGSAGNELLLASVQLPDAETEVDTTKGFGTDTIDVVLRLAHPEGEVNRARHCPSRPTLIATRPASAQCFVFDTERAAARAAEAPDDKEGGVAAPWLTLRGHGDEGYGMAWNPHTAGELATAANDGTICLWDVTTAKGDGDTPSWFAAASEVAVSDVAFSPRDPWTLGAVGDDRALALWDTRKPEAAALRREAAHAGDVNTVAFPRCGDDGALFRVLTGSADRSVKLWDARALKEPLHTFDGLDGDVLQVHWSPHEADVFACCGTDRRVTFFDISKVGAPRPPTAAADDDDDDDDQDPACVFVHAGHKATVSEFALSEEDRWLGASVSEDNVLQVWCVGEHIFDDDDDDDDDDDGADPPPVDAPEPDAKPASAVSASPTRPPPPGDSVVAAMCGAMPVPSPQKFKSFESLSPKKGAAP